MPQNEARAWWADVQHVRESIERRRGGAVETTAPGDPAAARRFARPAAESPVPRLAELDWPDDIPVPRTRRFERSERTDRGSGSADDERSARRHDRGSASPDDERTARRRDRHSGSPDDGRARRRPAAAEPERGSARGRRPRTELDVERTRSNRADDGRASARGAERPATATHAVAPRAAAADATPGRAPASPDFAVEPAPAPPTRRTVQITGRTVPAPRLVEIERRRPGRRPVERVGPRPDRIALYAVLLGFFLILVAATSAHAAI